MSEIELLGWFEGRVMPFLENHASERLPMLKADAARLRRLLRRSRECHVCFLGNAAIGKSTLINALAAGNDTLLPAGGFGPLTALATEVRYAKEPYFRAWYHPANRLWRLGFGLERRLTAQPNSGSGQADDAWKELDAAAKEDVVTQVQDLGDPNADAETARRVVLEAQVKQAQQLIAGNQSEERPLDYLVDGIRLACGYQPRWGSTPSSEDLVRIRRISQILAKAKTQGSFSVGCWDADCW